MLRAEDNKFPTESGAGTPMGAPPHVDRRDRYAVRSGACVATAVMVERFGVAASFAGRPTIAAAE
jgi:hypothetical protein